jgi:hypothetical protein
MSSTYADIRIDRRSRVRATGRHRRPVQTDEAVFRHAAALLGELRRTGASDATATLLARDPAAHASLDNPQAVAALLERLRRAGAGDATATLLARAADAGIPGAFLEGLAEGHWQGREPDISPSRWSWQEPTA